MKNLILLSHFGMGNRLALFIQSLRQTNEGFLLRSSNETPIMLELEKIFQVRDHIVACVGSARNRDREQDVSDFVEALHRKYPWAKIVSGEVSPVERTATVMAGMLGLRSIIIPTIGKLKKGK